MEFYENKIGKEGNGKPRHKIRFPRKKPRVLSLVSATLEIEYATPFLIIAAIITEVIVAPMTTQI